MGKKKKKIFENQVIIKMNPELRHVFAHLYYAIEAAIEKCPNSAMDNLKSIEGLIMFEGDEHKDWERYYKNFAMNKKKTDN